MSARYRNGADGWGIPDYGLCDTGEYPCGLGFPVESTGGAGGEFLDCPFEARPDLSVLAAGGMDFWGGTPESEVD